MDNNQTLWDMACIQQLKARYCRLIDTKQWEELRTVFASDARFEGFGSAPSGADVDIFIKGVSTRLCDVVSIHHCHMPEIVLLDASRARGVWAMMDYLEWTNGDSPHEASGSRGFCGYGHYEEEYVRDAAGWKISFLRLTRLRIDPLPATQPEVRPVALKASIGWLSTSVHANACAPPKPLKEKMIYRSGIFSKRANLGDEAFSKHWREVHGAIAARLPGLHSYRQNHIVERLYETNAFPGHPIDGISQLAFDDVGAMERAEVSPVYAEAKADIPRFQGAITILVLQEEPVIGVTALAPSGAAVRKLLLVSMARNQVMAAATHPSTAIAAPGHVGEPVHTMHNAVVDRSHPVEAGVPQGDLPITGMTEFWFGDMAALKAWVASSQGQRRLFADPLFEPMGIYVIEEFKVV